VVIGPDGALLNRHRKLMPTNPERMVWGVGDGTGLKVVDTPCGRIGTLICWENYMPLARAALYAQGIDILCAPTYDAGPTWLATMQHIAREGGCWVLGNGSAFRSCDVPDGLPGQPDLFGVSKDWVNDGDSVIVAPGSKIAAGPLHQAFGVVEAEIDLDRVALARRSLDVAGHYGRPDVFNLTIDRRGMPPVAWQDDV
jgi:nitrilase